MVNEGRSSGQDNASREGVGVCGALTPNAPRGFQVGHHLCERAPGHDGPHRCGICPHEWTDGLSSARTSAEAPSTDCPSSQPKDVN